MPSNSTEATGTGALGSMSSFVSALRRSAAAARGLAGLLRVSEGRMYRRHHYLHFEPKPGFRSDDGAVVHNSLGFRGPDVAVPKPAGTLRIACVGESSTYCVGLREDETWPHHLQARLAGLLPQARVEVVNAGVPAYVSSEVLLNFIFKVEPLEPDWLLYYFTVNDVRPRQLGTVSRDYREYCRLWPQRPKLTSISAIETYLRFHDSINYHVRNMLHVDHDEQNVFRTGPDVFRDNIRDMVALARARGIRVLLINPPFRDLAGTDADFSSTHPTSWAVAQHRASIAGIGREFGVPVLDMMGLMPKPPSSKAEVSPYFLDPIHMAAEGTKVFAGFVADRLRAEIEGRAAEARP